MISICVSNVSEHPTTLVTKVNRRIRNKWVRIEYTLTIGVNKIYKAHLVEQLEPLN